METKLIKLSTLPVIDYAGIQAIGEDLDKKLLELNLENQVVTPDTVATVKSMRANLNKEFDVYEEQRKTVKAAYMQPYNDFESAYKLHIGDKFKNANSILGAKTTEYDSILKSQKAEKLKSYFDEVCASHQIDFLQFSQVGLNITLSASEKSLKEQINDFVGGVAKDVENISIIPEEQSYRDEVMFEYKKTLDAMNAITIVGNRRKQLKEMAEQKAKEAEQKETQSQAQTLPFEPPTEHLPPPTVVVPQTEPEIRIVNFSASGTVEQLKALKAFALENGITLTAI